MPLKEFTTSSRWWDGLWGGGHTVETDPTQRGWQARRSPHSAEVVLIGRRGVKGCFSAVPLSGNRIDVALYDEETPEQVIEAWKTKDFTDPIYRQVPNIPGWALEFVRKIELPA